MTSNRQKGTTKILVVLNNHNSFGIVDLCIDLSRQNTSIVVDTVCTPGFAMANMGNFEKRGLSPRFLEPRAEFGAEAPSPALSGFMAIEHDARTGTRSKGVVSWLKTLAIKQVLNSSAYAAAREWWIVRRFRQKQKQALCLLAQLKPDVVLSLSDRSHDYVEGPVLWAARKTGIRIVLPYVAQFDIDAAIAYRHGADGQPDPDLCPFKELTLYKLLTYRRLREQVYRGLFFQAAYILNAASRVGILSSYPWWTGNGLSNVVCVDSRYTEEQYVKHRVPREKLVVLGHVQLDRVFHSHLKRETLRASLIQQYQLDNKKTLLILSMPQFAEQGYMSWAEHWREIDEIIGNVNKAGQNLLLSIHPRSDAGQYRYLEKRFKCCIVGQPLADVIGAADIFLASNSTTFAWSVLCGIPTIGLKSPVTFLWGHLPSIQQVDSSEMLATTIHNTMSTEPIDFSRDWEALSRNEVFDGKCGERFWSLLSSEAPQFTKVTTK